MANKRSYSRLGVFLAALTGLTAYVTPAWALATPTFPLTVDGNNPVRIGSWQSCTLADYQYLPCYILLQSTYGQLSLRFPLTIRGTNPVFIGYQNTCKLPNYPDVACHLLVEPFMPSIPSGAR